ncbi:nicotinate phosphoribosyltransferase [Natranaerobius trueperi]|uniref:Nicotinate phosphoribosyltransferase n=1 Tax=Natranaerobius trueperi TaxID=759412 RepID=A0A226BZA9_9FIRM|nr:nicotinate phosphoribosyltransferase [Natranaerobius trueperi]OWZ83654.1 nicotinate phosphoribosyltransferase [Natranaerobius trueperi]
MERMNSLNNVNNWSINSDRRLYSANHDEILKGGTTDIYFVRTQEILNYMDLVDKEVTVEIFASKPGLMAGTEEAMGLLADDNNLKVWALPEGESFEAKEAVMRITGPYSQVGIYETPLLGILASSAGWAKAAKECRDAAGPDKKLICFGARHLHPAVAPVMERSALVAGFDGCSCILGAKLMGKQPTGTVPHAVFLIVGDTLKVARAYHESMPSGDPRIVLVDTFKDEAEESLRLARSLSENLNGVRLDTPSERGGVTSGLVREVRARLNQEGYSHVNILASGGITPERITELKDEGVDAFGVGSYIAGSRANDMTMDIKEVEGEPVAKRGRIPGLSKTDRIIRYK